MIPRLLVALALAVSASAAQASPVARMQVPAARVVADGLDFPVGIAFAPDGRMFVTERSGRIVLVRDGRVRQLARIPTGISGETGLLDLAISPDVSTLYAFATDPDGETNRVWRVPIAGGRREVVVDDLPASIYHNGGGVAFADDGMLLVTHGEQHEDDRAQDPDVVGGKVYRLTPEGEIPADNPFGNSAALAIGLRNPFGVAVDPVSGRPYVTENGPFGFDEINRIEPGGNYGWPDVLGRAGDREVGGPGDYHDPLLVYEETIVPTGIAFADPRNARPRYRGDLFFGTYAEGTVHRVRLRESRRRAISDEVFVDPGVPVVAIAWGPEGLYYSTPEAIHVVPIARAGGRGERPAREGARSPPATPPPRPREQPAGESGPGLTLVAVAAAVLALAGAGALAIRRLRSR